MVVLSDVNNSYTYSFSYLSEYMGLGGSSHQKNACRAHLFMHFVLLVLCETFPVFCRNQTVLAVTRSTVLSLFFFFPEIEYQRSTDVHLTNLEVTVPADREPITHIPEKNLSFAGQSQHHLC